MKAVILAAGMGSRLKSLTEKIPKGLLKIDQKPLLKHSLDTLKRSDVSEVIFVVGYRGELIIREFGAQYKNLKIRYVKNESFSATGSMYSFSQAKDLIDDDILLLESDLLYESKAIDALLTAPSKDALLIAGLLNSGDDVYVCADAKDRVTYIGKTLKKEYKNNVKGALVGISKFSRSFLRRLFEKAANDYANNERNYHYEECVLETSLQGNPVDVVLSNNLNWIEVDTEHDYKRAKEEIYPRIKGGNNGCN